MNRAETTTNKPEKGMNRAEATMNKPETNAQTGDPRSIRSRMAKYFSRPGFSGQFSGKTRALIILLAIFIFLVAALSVSINMFIKANDAASQAERLERMVRETDSLGEVLKASDGNVQTAIQLLPEQRGAEVFENSLALYYTGSFEPSSKSDYKYRVSITLDPGQDGGCDSWQINWFTKTGEKALYNLSFKSISQ